MVISVTGMGKNFDLLDVPIIPAQGSIQVIVTPILGKQNVKLLEKVGMKGIFIGARGYRVVPFRQVFLIKIRSHTIMIQCAFMHLPISFPMQLNTS